MVRLQVLLLVALWGLGLHQARAQQAGAPPAAPPTVWQGLDVLVTPYVWLPWTHINIRPTNAPISSASTTIDPGRLYNQFTWVPFLGEVELRDGPFGVMIDYMHVPVKEGISTRNILFSGGTAAGVTDTGTAMFLYRPYVQPDQYVDVGMGVRAWGLSGTISLNEGLAPAAVVSNGLSWADPLVGARYHRELGNGFSATAYGDVGGFGAGAHIDWQLIGTIDYAVNSWIDVHGGFRTLNYSYSAPAANFNVNMYGPILSATFRF
jgi:hypothetical protein